VPCSIYELYSDFVMKNPFYEVEQVCVLGLWGLGGSLNQPKPFEQCWHAKHGTVFAVILRLA
jgi:hypothetical protein